MLTLLSKLRSTGLLTLKGIASLATAPITTGINLMALLRTVAKLHPERIALVDDRERYTYRELLQQSESVAAILQQQYGIRGGQQAAIICRNHASAVKSLFALSLLGAHTTLVSPEIGPDGLCDLEEEWGFDLYIYDSSSAHLFESSALRATAVPAYHETGDSIQRMSSQQARLKAGRGGGRLILLSGGTTGRPKAVPRRPSAIQYMPPFNALLTTVKLNNYRSLYVATPIVHGFGLASLIMGIALGAEIYLSEKFDAKQSCTLIKQNKIEVVALVPLALKRILNQGVESLSSLRCILIGGSSLSPELANEAHIQLGQKLFNLYGTSEAGVCIISTPEMIQQKPESIGKPMKGVRVQIVDDLGNEVADYETGQLRICSAWTTNRKHWLETGDLAYRDVEGYIFLAGRIDDMIVSGGHNVYPMELERILRQHPELESVAVVGLADEDFGQRLKSIVVRKQNSTIDEAEILRWLRPRVARYQMPSAVEFREELPYTSLGKVDRNLLKNKVIDV
ncbi:MAG: class I adenylate-forming enzyme family protein [Candidatus Kapaibacterium sp.]